MATVVSVNVGLPRTTEWKGRQVTSAIWKEPVAGRIHVQGVNLVGDDQADRRVHGGYDKAVYTYAQEDYAWWSEQLDEELQPGTFGENLTTEGINLDQLVIGQRISIGTTTLEAAEPRMPCYKLGMRMGDAKFKDRFDDAQRYGAYLRIIDEGDVGAGDTIEVATPPTHGFTIRDLGDAYNHTTRAKLERASRVDD